MPAPWSASLTIRVRLRDIATALGITERTAFGIVTDLTEAGYVVKDKDGRRNRYRIQDHLPLPEAVGRERTIGEVLGLLIDTERQKPRNCQTETPRPTDQLRSVANAPGGVTESLRRRATCAPTASELRRAQDAKISDSERLATSRHGDCDARRAGVDLTDRALPQRLRLRFRAVDSKL